MSASNWVHIDVVMVHKVTEKEALCELEGGEMVWLPLLVWRQGLIIGCDKVNCERKGVGVMGERAQILEDRATEPQTCPLCGRRGYHEYHCEYEQPAETLAEKLCFLAEQLSAAADAARLDKVERSQGYWTALCSAVAHELFELAEKEGKS